MEFIGMPSIFKDKVTSSIPAYLKNTEAPILCYKYNKSIRSTISNFNKLASDLDIAAKSPIHETVRNPNILIPQLVMLLPRILNHFWF